MAIRSDTFGSVRLSGRDAERFVEQVRDGRPNDAAVSSAKRGREMLVAMRQSGTFTVNTKEATSEDGRAERI